jgi:hypothetical protein
MKTRLAALAITIPESPAQSPKENRNFAMSMPFASPLQNQITTIITCDISTTDWNITPVINILQLLSVEVRFWIPTPFS